MIPGSDSGKAEEAWALCICFSFDRGFVPASCTKITFRNQELFGYFFAEKKYQEDLKFKGQMNLPTEMMIENESRMLIKE